LRTIQKYRKTRAKARLSYTAETFDSFYS
jgi:hypothetical protein